MDSFSKDSHTSAKPRETSELDITLKVKSTSVGAPFDLVGDEAYISTFGEGEKSFMSGWCCVVGGEDIVLAGWGGHGD